MLSNPEAWLKRLSDETLQAFSPDSWSPSPLTSSWPMTSWAECAACLAVYFTVVPALMSVVAARGGRGVDIKPVVIVHNLAMTLLSAYMCIETVRQAILANYSLFGNAVDSTISGLGMARIIHIFYVSKGFEFLDTFIMAIRGRWRQITFLHIYHHSSIFLIWFIIARYYPGGESYFSCALNSFVHVIMYGYYLWSAIAPSNQSDSKPTWTQPGFYRRYITRLQLAQFVIMMAQATYDLVVPSAYPFRMALILFLYMWTMLALFSNFYSKSYSAKAPANAHKFIREANKAA